MLKSDQIEALLRLDQSVLTPKNQREAYKQAALAVQVHRKYLQDEKKIGIPDHRALKASETISNIIGLCIDDSNLQRFVTRYKEMEQEDDTPLKELKVRAFSAAAGFFLNFTLK